MYRSLLLCMVAGALSVGAQQPPTNPGNPGNPGAPGMPGNPMPNAGGLPGQSPTYTPGTMPDSPGTAVKADDRKFVRDAAIGGMTEVEIGKLAAQKGSSEAVKQFGQRMVDEHGKANEQLREVAVSRSMSVPDSLDSKHKSRVDKLSKLSGAEFDKAFIKDQLKDHQQDVRNFQNEAQNGTDPAVKNFASKTLPTLQSHLDAIKGIDKGEKGNNSADRSKQ